MSALTLQQNARIIACLCEGVSIRATERLLGHHRDSIMRLGVSVGEGCVAIHQRLMQNIQVSHIELDEVWSFVKKKRKVVVAEDEDTVGDQFIFIAMDAIGKAIITWHVGKRTTRNTHKFVADLRTRVLGEPTITTDGFPAYQPALDLQFENAPRGIVDKQTVIVTASPDSERYHAREGIVKIERRVIQGQPTRIGTSFVERQNLTLRQSQRRLTRLSNGFSKKFKNHYAAISLYATHYNFCRVHETLRVTPAMQLGIADHIWSVEELVVTAMSGDVRQQVFAIKGRFHVIQGGKVWP